MISIGNAVVGDDVADKFFWYCDVRPNACKRLCSLWKGEWRCTTTCWEVPHSPRLFTKRWNPTWGEKGSAIDAQGPLCCAMKTATWPQQPLAAKGVPSPSERDIEVRRENLNGDIDFKKPISCHLYQYALPNTINLMRWIMSAGTLQSCL